MKLRLSYALGLIASGLIVFAVTCASAQTTANGPYYATPSWDQQLPASTRFVVLSNWNNEAVLDRETGLVWQRQPSTSLVSWYDASSFCDVVAIGHRRGWRLPTLAELSSLGEYQPNGAFDVPPGNPFIGYVFFDFWVDTVQQRVLLSEVDAFLTYTQAFGETPPPSATGPFTGLGSSPKDAVVAGAWCVRSGSAAPPSAVR